MLRKITLGLIAAASLSVAALASGSASAHGFHSGWGHGGWGHHWGYGVGFYPSYVGCIRNRWVDTPYGLVLQRVNVCY